MASWCVCICAILLLPPSWKRREYICSCSIHICYSYDSMGNVFHILPVLAKFNKAFVVCSIYNHLKEFIQKLSRHRCQSQHRTIHHKKWHVDPKRQAQLRRTQNLVSFFSLTLCYAFCVDLCSYCAIQLVFLSTDILCKCALVLIYIHIMPFTR